MQNTYIGVRRSGLTVLLFTIITCGIYQFYWLYQVMEDINKASGERRLNSGGLLLASILCMPLIWVAYYKIDKELMRLSAENGCFYRENFVMWLVLSFLCGIGLYVADFNVCGGFNEIWDKRQKMQYQQYDPSTGYVDPQMVYVDPNQFQHPGVQPPQNFQQPSDFQQSPDFQQPPNPQQPPPQDYTPPQA